MRIYTLCIGILWLCMYSNYVYIYTYIYIYTHIYTNIYIYTYIYIHMIVWLSVDSMDNVYLRYLFIQDTKLYWIYILAPNWTLFFWCRLRCIWLWGFLQVYGGTMVYPSNNHWAMLLVYFYTVCMYIHNIYIYKYIYIHMSHQNGWTVTVTTSDTAWYSESRYAVGMDESPSLIILFSVGNVILPQLSQRL